MPTVQATGEIKKPWKVAIVTSLFNRKWTQKLEEGAVRKLAEYGLEPFVQVSVPGAIEIPLAVKALLQKKQVDAVVALGLVIRGETSHYDYVCQAVERGCNQLQLEFNKPVAFGILTTENKEQAKARCGGTEGHKGEEATQAALDMLQVLDQISTL